MKTLNLNLIATKLLASLVFLVLGTSVASAFTEEDIANWRVNQKDTFSVLLNESDLMHLHHRDDIKGRIKVTCYRDDRADWSMNAVDLGDIKEKQGGRKCWRGFVNVSVVGEDGKWRRIAKLKTCSNRKHMRFAWVTHVTEDFRGATPL